jgi:hypothetical protein
MKKFLDYFDLYKPNSNWHKSILTMKISAILLFCCLVNIFAAPAYSQTTKISLNLKDATIEDVLNKIEDVSEFYFLFNHKLINIYRKVDIEADNAISSDVCSGNPFCSYENREGTLDCFASGGWRSCSGDDNIFLTVTPLKAEVVAGMTSVSEGNITTSTLTPASVAYSASASTPQDEGYFLRLTSNGQPIALSTFEFSAQISSGWSDWQDFKLGNTLLASDQNGIVKIDYADWPKIMVGSTTLKFRLRGTSEESNPVTVTITVIDPEKYFRYYQQGNYWIFRGCQNYTQTQVAALSNSVCADTYEVRWNAEEAQNVSITYHGETHSISSIPLRETSTANTPTSETGGNTNFTTFLSSGYDPYKSIAARWILKSVFYNRQGSGSSFNTNDLHVLEQTRVRTAIFWPIAEQAYPPYYFISRPMDLYPNYEYRFNTFDTTDPNFSSGTIPDSISPSGTGWKTDYRVINVNLPKYKGRVLRIRFWEYATANANSYIQATAWNFDEWMFAQNIGIIGINNKIGRGQKCSSDPDCRNETVLMQTPSYSVSLYDYMLMNANLFSVKVSLANALSTGINKITLDPAHGPYYLFVTNSKGKPYTGPLEVEGVLTPNSGSVTNINRQVFRDIDGLPVWIENGVGLVKTGANQILGTYSVRIRPLIFSSVQTMGDNTLPFSNTIEVVYNNSTSTPLHRLPQHRWPCQYF